MNMRKNIIKNPTTNKELLESLISRLDHMETHLPNGELKVILNHIETIMDKQEKMYDDLSDLKKILLNPEDGVVVRVNKNTEYRIEQKQREEDLDILFEEYVEFKKFKGNVVKFLWVVITTIIGSIVMLWERILKQ